ERKMRARGFLFGSGRCFALRLGLLGRRAFSRLQHDELGADGDVIARLTAERHDAAGDRRGHLDHGLVGRHLDHRLVLGDVVADFDVPRDDLGGDRAFAEIRKLHHMAAHFASIVAFNAAATRAWPGKYSHSNACGYGVSQPATRAIGASRCQKHSSWMVARISAPKPAKRVASCATTQRPVFFTERTSVSSSSGTIVRRSITSASMPSDCAAAIQTCTIVPYVMIVTCLPARTISAVPIGTR